ncbi:retinal rod rhodopsin-sensitive cGMP 3',5'-cyclic phosphodiesterase subunit gamma [Platysternon megacephalum]|uniref:Retinal rod rhodopsin-sensitive cGMP 3',5'-cyclic phosphodiesterase subunit gamma n=1 Tax=Platysternon megacephalum TaxID=55544 RepID=A0A4D9E6R7_9SAUR|nr:retinal rod rhodopsin-sensitive cGMP 3',5'-cyclic phosphodiesterase subunit gamma [Platysternon megacephalum]
MMLRCSRLQSPASHQAFTGCSKLTLLVAGGTVPCIETSAKQKVPGEIHLQESRAAFVSYRLAFRIPPLQLSFQPWAAVATGTDSCKILSRCPGWKTSAGWA